ncbi:septum formation initiator family protein [Modestobacter sp. Leaf380]|uniref:FtsB family cell division protein n=1 Tax=Modestobacter sp. Leaf380 TaxID=1736356 RepID=UPI0006F28BC0|nr:septum formation initiator family protein [Modestobacter sp. Leaf380]KQS68431.1 septum formation inhibitor [Modestobacter sp. Leaf380]
MATARTRRSTSGGPRRRTASRPERPGARGSADLRQGRRRTRRPARTATSARRTPLFTGRAVLLGALVLLLLLTLAGPVRSYVAGRQELAELAAESQALSLREEQLRAELERQSDPAYIAQQARERLNYVLPGDRLVVIADGEVVEGEQPAQTPDAAVPEEQLPWYTGLMESVTTADGTP